MLSNSPKSFDKENLPIILTNLINDYISNNRISAKAYKEITALSHYDEAVGMFFFEKEKEIANKVCKILIDNGVDSTNIKEKVQLIMGLIDNLCNGIIYHDIKDFDLDYKVMIDIVVKEITNILL